MSAATFTFSSKADTLAALSCWPELNIPAMFAFTVAEWRADAGAVHAREQAAHAPQGGLRVPVRSSCRGEDSAARIGRVAKFVAARTGPCPGLFGWRFIPGVTPDWKPE